MQPHATGRLRSQSQSSSLVGPLQSDKKGSGGEVPTVKSGRKELAYDEATGRFYEASDREECESPDDEFCMLDKASGKMIRLTLEEKERIFMDALQVSFISRWHRLFAGSGPYCYRFASNPIPSRNLSCLLTHRLLPGVLLQWKKVVKRR